MGHDPEFRKVPLFVTRMIRNHLCGLIGQGYFALSLGVAAPSLREKMPMSPADPSTPNTCQCWSALESAQFDSFSSPETIKLKIYLWLYHMSLIPLSNPGLTPPNADCTHRSRLLWLVVAPCRSPCRSKGLGRSSPQQLKISKKIRALSLLVRTWWWIHSFAILCKGRFLFRGIWLLAFWSKGPFNWTSCRHKFPVENWCWRKDQQNR